MKTAFFLGRGGGGGWWGGGVNGQLEFHDSLSTAAYSVYIQ